MKQKPGGLSLERFAKAKQSGYDKKARKAKELALNAKKVNQYRKLKQKLAAKGSLAPRYTYEQQEGQVEMLNAQPRRGRDKELAMERIHARAGPAPDSVGESGEDEMLGPQSDSDSGNEAPGQGAELSAHASTQSREHAKQRNRQRVVPRGPSEQHQSSDPDIASLAAADVRESAAKVGRHQPEASAAGPRHADQGRAGNRWAESKSEREHEHEEEHSAEAALGRKQKRGKKRKPASQLQRVQAEVQAKKEAEQREREERRRRIQEHASRVAEAEQRRKERTKLLRKRTQQGQPVMRYRMDKILDQLQAEAAQS